ncbi:MAG: winged helix-turn-helix transcriptional regulator [Alphaproteobacteria bacterium]|nr:winged helix-turn-helix transcriptional regulator [Alphaproteobacteria bacterium]
MTDSSAPASRRALEDDARVREILERIEQSETINQRRLAADLGVALGLVNAYVNRCVTKGWVKVQQVPARRYRYYLTPKGFAEKSRLTLQFLNDSFVALRRARASFERLYDGLEAQGARRVALAGDDDLVDIAMLAARGRAVEIVGAWNPLDGPTPAWDAARVQTWIVASARRAVPVREALVARLGEVAVAAPDVLPMGRKGGR